ncbi:MAG TPA: metal-sensitive transcriptional regulator [Nocardioides sp.]|nr:metal-sensitive transcriptional regulator [Nocardioides sp.]
MSEVLTASPAVVNRLKRAQGQLSGVLRMIDEGRDVEQIVHQLKAVSTAIDRAGFALLVIQLKEAVEEEGDVGEAHVAQLERLFLSLA